MGRTITWKNLIGQERVKHYVSSVFKTGTFGHAYLFCGPVGVGTLQAALELALALHCTSRDQSPCYRCDSCLKLLNNADPDFHCAIAVALQKEHRSSSESSITEEGWRFVAQQTLARLANPYTVVSPPGSIIPVDTIRELNHTIQRGSISGKTNIVIICEADTLPLSSANAFLKTLEEPPQNTLILLLATQLHAVLPTIRSRCQVVRFSTFTASEVKEALVRIVPQPPDLQLVETCSRECEGSLGKALSMLDEKSAVIADSVEKFMSLCFEQTVWFTITGAIEQMVATQFDDGSDYSAAENFIHFFLSKIRTLCFRQENGAGTADKAASAPVCSNTTKCMQLDYKQAAALYEESQHCVTLLRKSCPMLLAFAQFTFSVVEILHGKKQQVG
ncbi:MAG: hypothetical protein JW795_13180 [Chitinivibrionales bacterium]|nr:hypothetical protein [Chitinivibrionales bacterium]